MPNNIWSWSSCKSSIWQFQFHWLYRWSLPSIYTTASGQSQLLEFMVLNLLKMSTELRSALSMSKMFTLQISQPYLINRYCKSCTFHIHIILWRFCFHFNVFMKLPKFQHGVAIRSGHHCAQLLHRHLGVNASARASLHFYNTKEDVDSFIQALHETIEFFNMFR